MFNFLSSKSFWISFVLFECIFLFNISAGSSSMEFIKVFAAATLVALISAFIVGGIIRFIAQPYQQR